MKKIISLILSAAMTVSVTSAAFAAGVMGNAAKPPAAAVVVSEPDEKAYEGWVENFEEDFSMGSRMWELYRSFWGEEKIMNIGGFSQLKLKSDLSWKDYMLEFDYHQTGMTGDYFRFTIKGQESLYRVGDGQIRWLETPAGEFHMKEGGDYHYRCVAKGDSIKIYISGTGIVREKLVAEMNGNTAETGSLQFVGYYESSIDNIKVWVPEDSKQVVKNKLEMLPVGNQIPYGFLNNDGAGLTYESLNPTIAEVSDDGTITAAGSGYATIRAKNSSGQVVETKGVYCYVPATSLSFESAEKTKFYEGDTIGVHITAGPTGTYTVPEWSIDDPSMAELYAPSQSRKAITFNKAGDVTLTVKDMLSGKEVKETFNILPAEEKYDKSADTAFYLTGKTTETHQELVGAHINVVVNTDEAWEAINGLGMGSVRTEHGQIGRWRSIDSNGNDTGPEENRTIPFAQWVETNRPGYADTIKKSNIKAIIIPSAIRMRTEDYLEVLDYFKKLCDQYGKELIAELGNETYALAYTKYYETAEDYIKWAAEMADAIHEKYPDLKCLVCGMDVSGETNILSDDSNTQAVLQDNWAYTQGGRIAEWNALVAEYKDHFDGVTIHDYFSWEFGEQISEDDFIKAGFAWVSENQKLTANLWDRVGLPFYHTETGNLAANMFWAGGMSTADQIRYQWQAYPYPAIRHFEQMLTMIEEGHTISMNFHMLDDTQGFGMMWNDGKTKAPMYYLMQTMGNIIKEADTFYELDAPDADYYVMDRPFYHGKDRASMVNNVDAWAFGNKDEGVSKVVMINHTNVKQTVSVDGAGLTPTWSYGGSAQELLPDWLRNKDQTSCFMNASWDEIITSVMPKTYENAETVDKYELDPYTVMIFDVSGAPGSINESATGKITGFAQAVMENSLALFVNKPYAYRDNRKVAVDPDNAEIAPVVKDDRTLLPLRFVAESFKCEVGYDDATNGITITGDGIDIKMTIGETAYTVNGEDKYFDVPAEVVNGRTLVPLRALAEAIGMEVYWDERGLIAIYPPKTGFVSKAEWFNATMQPSIDSLVNLFTDK